MSSPIAARRFAISRRLKPASISTRVRSVAMKVELPALLLANMQTLTIALLPNGYIRQPPLNQLPLNRVYKICFNKKSPFLAASTIRRFMKARVYVSMKPAVLDPQGQTICGALNGLGHKEIASVRQGKYFEIG